MNDRFLPCDVRRELLEKADVASDSAYGTPPSERQIEEYIKKGIINVDKPPGPTSHEVVSWVKKILNVKKAGHAGTLEPPNICWRVVKS
ncbi:MAG: hypothetical protein QXO71_06185 [Candidatus Jordarchaeaceae archaeon]